MFRIKRLYSFILEAFIPLLFATFGVCLFILLMQFLWKYVDAMVGKGIDMVILAKMFFYAALTLIPLTLPLAVLLASLMTFGNLGEHLELLAIKSAGVSLLRIMRPIVFLLILVCGLSFYFQNNILPATNVKLYTIILSMKQKSPELDIPEGIFYKEISNYNVYVKQKDKKTGVMRDMMIYDFSKGFENTVVIVADSGRLKVSEDKLYLVLTLYNGESFENYTNKDRGRTPDEKSPYRRETFDLKEILIRFDSNFNMADESIMTNQDVSKNLKELITFVDSSKLKSDTLNRITKDRFRDRVYASTFKSNIYVSRFESEDSDTIVIGNWDDFWNQKSLSNQKILVDRAKSRIESARNEYNYEVFTQNDRLQRIRGHEIEIQRRFSFSIACLLFFFIGGPLGAIVRKGGLGMPAVLSVFLFLFYYTIDIFGLKMARQGVWPVWQGMWMSTVVLTILGAFLTYKAVNDSVIMNPDAWKDLLKRFFGKREVRNYQRKEVIITVPDYEKDISRMELLTEKCKQYLQMNKKWPRYSNLWKKGFEDKALKEIVNQEEEVIDDLRNSTENLILGKLMDYPIIKPGYPDFLNNKGVRLTCAVLFPVGLIIYLISLYKRKGIRQDVMNICKINEDICKELQNLDGIKSRFR